MLPPMPWEAKRWVIYALLMAVLSILALGYNPSCYGIDPSWSPKDLKSQ